MAPDRFTLITHVVRRGDGQGRVNLEIVKEALRNNVHVTIVASEVSPELLLEKNVEWHRVPVAGFPSNLLKETVFSIRSARILANHRSGPLLSNGCITSVPAHVNACHFVHSSWLASPVHASKLIGGPKGAYQKLYSSWNARLEKQAYKAAGTVVAVSEQVKRELSAASIDATKIVTIPNGVDTDEFLPGPADRKHFRLPDDIPLGLFAGDIRSPRKGLDTALRALSHVPGLHLAVAGSTENSPYPRMAIELGVADRVHFLGSIKEMPLLMRSCDMFVFPSRYEACSLVMLEAMASGLPVITPRTTGGAELVPEDGGYLLDNPDDEAGLASILQSITDNRSSLVARSQRSRDCALSLRWDVMGRRYLDLLARCTKASPA